MVLVEILLIMILMAVFLITGSAISTVFKIDKNMMLNMILGYMFYYGAFEIIYIVCLLFKNSLVLLKILWIISICVMLISSVIIAIYGEQKVSVSDVKNTINKNWKFLITVGVVEIVLILVYVCGTSYVARDTYAYNVIGDCLNSGKMYFRDVYTGMELKRLDMSYAISGYYMHTAVLCSIFRITPVIMQHNVIGVINMLMNAVVIYSIGKNIFCSEIKSVLLIVFNAVVNICLLFCNNEKYYLLTGAYDEMTQLPYIIIPVLILGFICFMEQSNRKNGWMLIMLCSIASVGLSVQSLTVVPIVLIFGILTVMISSHKYGLLPSMLVWIFPEIVYGIIYKLCA